VAALVVLAAIGWWWTAEQMRGMHAGPWTPLGAFGWFLVVWVVMMAAMMFPSVSPTVALSARMTRSGPVLAPVVFVAGYLLIWSLAGAAAWVLAVGAGRFLDHALIAGEGGRILAGVTVLAAGVYELTPLKDVCLRKCRSPLGTLLGSWRDGRLGGLRMGMVNGGWCLGCCWALMASLFALGVMSTAWMAFIAALIAVEKMLPWRRVVTWGTAAVLVVLGLLVLLMPDVVPGLTVPGEGSMPMM
jgi:predicted metal-binding membrane protein